MLQIIMPRKLASFRRILEISEISYADNIEIARVNSWQVVTKKGQFQKDTIAVYFEIDSWIPTKYAPFLKQSTYRDIPGSKLETIKIRGVLSQGLLLPISHFPELENVEVVEDMDLTEILGIQKWESLEENPYLNDENFKNRKAQQFPANIPKTDQERVQNLRKEFEVIKEAEWEITEKLDGSSITIYYEDDNIQGVCSRNLNLNMMNDNNVDKFWKVVLEENLLEKLKNICKENNLSLALQGELVGPKFCSNNYKLSKPEIYIYDIFDIKYQRYYLPHERQEFVKKYEIKHVPILENNRVITTNIDELLIEADGKSALNNESEREGIVFKNIKKSDIRSFKVISNKYLS